MQGYLFGRPQPAEAIAALLLAGRNPARERGPRFGPGRLTGPQPVLQARGRFMPAILQACPG